MNTPAKLVPSKLKFQTDINGLRGVSVLLVVLYHFNIGVFKGGFIGVDIFFVISGYLMTKIIVSGMLKERFSYLDFVTRRALRIFPALFFMIAVLLVIGVVALTPSDLKSLAEQSLQAVFFNSNNYFAGKQGYFSAGADDRWLLHTWSLSVEWQFYMLYPALIWLCFSINRLNKRDNLLLFKVGLVSFLLMSFLYCALLDSQHSFFSVFTRAWQMIAGGMVYLIVSSKTPAARKNQYLSYIGLAIIALSALVVKQLELETAWPGYFAVMPIVGACVLLLAQDEQNIILNNRIIQSIGSWSYSVYLWHWPLIIGLTITGLMIEQPKLSKIFGFLFSILLGYFSFRFIESNQFFQSRLSRISLIKLGVAAAVLLAGSYIVVDTQGLMGRVQDPLLFKQLDIAEKSHTYEPKCENESIKKDKFCQINPNMQGKKILVIGDSHAGHLYPWFLENSRVNTTFYVKSGCPVILGFERMGQNLACREFSKAAYRLAESGTYQTVIISQNWTGFTAHSQGICSYEDGNCVSPAQSQTALSPVEQMHVSIEKILSKHVNVAIVDATPWFTVNVPKKIGRDVFWYGNIKPTYNSHVFFQDNSGYDAMFNSLKTNLRFSVLSLRDQLCKSDECRIYDEKAQVSIFKDYDHFNPVWIAKHGNVFSAVAY